MDSSTPIARTPADTASEHAPIIWGLDLAGADLAYRALRGEHLAGANLAGARLVYADLSDANLCGADLTGALLVGVNLSRANLCGAILRGTTLQSAQLAGAYFDDDTRWPEGFEPLERGCEYIDSALAVPA